MGGGQDARSACLKARRERLRVASPHQRDQRDPGRTVVRDEVVDDPVGDLLSAAVRTRLPVPDAQCSVEEQHALVDPGAQVPVGRVG